jgi:inner membrane protein YidH
VASQGTGGTADLPNATQLAVERTRLAYERTLMAWVRTATSLISFGFTIYKFFQFLREEGAGTMPHADHFLGPRPFALLLILVGLGTLVLATLQHRQHMQMLRAQGASIPYSLAMGLALLVVVIGFLGLFVVLFRQ